MKNLTRILLMVVAAAASVPGAAQTPDSSARAALGTGGLNPGDHVLIVVWRKPEFSGDFTIAANGTIIHPLYRDVQVTGVPMSVVEDRLRAYLTRYETTPQFVIQPLVRIVIGGEVRSPNIYSVPPETTISQALALAGGATDRGEVRDIRVIRDRQEIKMDISRPDSDAGVLQIRSGDQILVGRKRGSVWTIIGPITSSIAAAAAITTVIRR